MQRNAQQDRRRPVTIAVAAPAAGAHGDRAVTCASCGNLTPLGAAWIIPQGLVICTDCAAPVLRRDLERRLELLRIQDAQDLRAIQLPPSLAGEGAP